MQNKRIASAENEAQCFFFCFVQRTRTCLQWIRVVSDNIDISMSIFTTCC